MLGLMGILIKYIIVYVLGGLTFLPLVILVVLLHAHLTLPIRDTSSESSESFDPLRANSDDEHDIKSRESAAGLAAEFQRNHEPDVAAGYFAVCREYVPGGINGKPPERATPAGNLIAAESPSVYQAMYTSIFSRKQGPTLDPAKGNGKTVKRGRNVFFVVLRHGHLMLYEDSEQLEVKHVISLEHHNISIYGDEGTIPEGELWIKRNAIRLTRKARVDDDTSKPFFFFSENCSDKEDFYFALLQNQDVKTGDPDSPPRPQQYETKNIIGLVRRLHSSEEQLQTRWFNALVGRLFLALYQTKEVEDYIRKKITKKIARVKKPVFLSGIVLRKMDLGESAPSITNPRLKDLTVDGDCCVEADVKYSGNFRLEIAATVRIDLSTRIKAREVNIVLAVVVKKMDGHALLKFKPPPSNRIWLSFESMPDMEMAIEPIVSSRQITYGIILRAIESRIREVIAETLVLPHWDDSPFTDTTQQKFRGGIWERAQSQNATLPDHVKIPDEAPEDEADAGLDVTLIPPSPRTKDERTMSMPAIPDAEPSSPLVKAASSSTQTLVDTANTTGAAGAQKPEKPPKALRSRSFASAANPLLSMDNANVDSSKLVEKRKSKQHKDATSSMMAISNRAGPASPSEAPLGSSPNRPTLWEASRETSSRSSTISNTSKNTDQALPREVLSESPTQTSRSATPTSISSRSNISGFGSDHLQANTTQNGTHLGAHPERKQSMAAIGAATAAAKKWGWGVLARNTDQKNQLADKADRVGTPKNPIGRGRPLPPPGQPLPFPDGQRSKTIPAPATRRKPVPPPALPARHQNGQGQQDGVKVRTPPPLPNRRRQSSTPMEKVSADEGLLVVEAPPESEPSSPKSEKEEEYFGNTDAVIKKASTTTSMSGKHEGVPSDQANLTIEKDCDVVPSDQATSSVGKADLEATSKSPEEEDDSFVSWQFDQDTQAAA